MTKRWIKESDDTTPAQICPAGYSSISVLRKDKNWRRTCSYSQIQPYSQSTATYEYNTVEYSDCILSLPNITIHMCVLYRPPHTSVLAFCDDLANYMERNILLFGEVNIPPNQQDHPDMVLFKGVLDGIFPTHELRNSLYIIINISGDTFVTDLTQDILFSDHILIIYNIITRSNKCKKEEVAYRKTKNFISGDFSKDITEKLYSANLSILFLDELVKLYNDTLSAVLDDTSPLKRKKAPTYQKVPWFSGQISKEIRLRRKAEWAWPKDMSNPAKYLSFCWQGRSVLSMIDHTKRNTF